MSVFAVSKIRLGDNGQISEVLWGVVDTKSNHWVSSEVATPVCEVIDAIRNGDHVVALFPATNGHMPGPQFVVKEDAGQYRIELEDALASDRALDEMDKLE